MPKNQKDRAAPIPLLHTLRPELFNKVQKRGKLKHVLAYGKKLMQNLTFIYKQLHPISPLKLWPEEYRSHVIAYSKLWKNMLYNLLSTDEERNTRMCDYATLIFEQLSSKLHTWITTQINLWVVFCESVSELIEDDELFIKVVEVILNAARHEKSCLPCRLVDAGTLLSDNSWHIMCKNIILYIKDEFLLCNITLLLLALSGKEKSRLYSTLKDGKVVDSNETLLTTPMSEECWENIVQVIELLKQKRELMHKLSNCTEVEVTNVSTKPALLESCASRLVENNAKSRGHGNDKQVLITDSHDLIAFDNSTDKVTEHANVKQEPTTDSHDFIAFDNSTDKATQHANVKQEPTTDSHDLIAFDNSTDKATEHANVKQEPTTDSYDFIAFDNGTDKAIEHAHVHQEPTTGSHDFIAFDNNTDKVIEQANVKQEPTTDTHEFITLDNSTDKSMEHANVKQEPATNTHDFIAFDNSTDKVIEHVNVKQEATTDTYDFIPFESSTNKAIEHAHVKQEPKTDNNDFIAFNNNTNKAKEHSDIKQEPTNTQDFIAFNNDAKQKTATNKQVTNVSRDTKIKEEKLNIKQEILEKQKEEPQEHTITEINKEIDEEEIIFVDAEEKPKEERLSLDKLILEYSIKQINISSGNITVIDLIDLSEDENDCSEGEDKKIPVEQLLTMYQDMVTNKPSKLVRNPLSTVDESVQDSEEKHDKPKAFDFLAPSTSHVADVNRKQSSTSTASNKSRMKTPMSVNKQQNKIRKRRNKTKEHVQKLYKKLRDESLASTSTVETTVIELDKTESYTPKKRKNESLLPCGYSKIKKKRYYSKTIPDVEASITVNQDQSSYTPKKPIQLHCSTPVAQSNSNPEFIPLKSNLMQPNNNKPEVNNLNEEVTDLTKEINRDSYVTIDLTAETLNFSSISKAENTVIDLDNSVDNVDCTVISVHSNANLSISGESDVTVLNMSQAKKDRQMRNFAKGIAKLDASEKGRLLELITQNIFSGCNMLNKKESLHNVPETSTRATETAEDTYIKEVILGQACSRNSIGSNIYNPERDARNKVGLRMIVIDGSNVAMEHGRGTRFSVKGLKICIDYFLKRGHVVKAFVPRFRCKYGKSTDPRLLDQLERQGLVVYTPSREIQGRTVTSYDDRYIIQCAAEFDGVIVSGDNYRDLMNENPRWRYVIENRLLQFTWVHDMIMFPKDPLGRNGPTLEQFLKHSNPQQMNKPTGSVM